MTIQMSDLQQGQQGRVHDVQSGGSIRRRLFDLGLVPGTTIERIMASPIGDPVCYWVRGAMIALRSEDANQITVTVQS